jgi:alpha-D-ribose 1-methylphosphonate 5-triphosphate synthase subunit PhnH
VNGTAGGVPGHGRLDPLVGQMSTQVFRSLLRSVSRPGTIEVLRSQDQARLLYGDALAMLAIPALALANVDVKLCGLGGISTRFVTDIAVATDASVSGCADADLVLADRFVRPEEVRLLRVGTAIDPHLSARLCLQVDELCEVIPAETKPGIPVPEEFDMVTSEIVDSSGLDPVTIELRGPGVRGAALRRVHGLSTSVLDAIVDMNRTFPVGIDTHLISRHGELMSIPRTTRVRVVPIEPLPRSTQREKCFVSNQKGREPWAM